MLAILKFIEIDIAPKNKRNQSTLDGNYFEGDEIVE